MVRPQEIVHFGKIREINTLSYQTYGKYYGWLDSGEHIIDLLEQKKSLFDTLVIISTCLQCFTTEYVHSTYNPIPVIPINLDPWKIFKYAKFLIDDEGYKKHDPKVQRYVLGLRENPSKDDIDESYKNLFAEWSPKSRFSDPSHPKYDEENIEFVQQVLNIIKTAKHILEHKKGHLK